MAYLPVQSVSSRRSGNPPGVPKTGILEQRAVEMFHLSVAEPNWRIFRYLGRKDNMSSSWNLTRYENSKKFVQRSTFLWPVTLPRAGLGSICKDHMLPFFLTTLNVLWNQEKFRSASLLYAGSSLTPVSLIKKENQERRQSLWNENGKTEEITAWE